jgi:hypothetical protein
MQLLTLIIAARAVHLPIRLVRPRWTASLQKLGVIAVPALIVSGAAQLMLLSILLAQ